MSQVPDFSLANQSGRELRLELNNVLDAIVSQNSGDTEPASPVANMWWADTIGNRLKRRNKTNTSWINFGDLSSAKVSDTEKFNGQPPSYYAKTEDLAKVSDSAKLGGQLPEYYATDTELSALSQSLSGSVQSLFGSVQSLYDSVHWLSGSVQSKVATVNGIGPDAGGNVTLPVPDSGGARLVHSYTGNAQIDLYGNWGTGLYICWADRSGTATVSVSPHNSETISLGSTVASISGAARYFNGYYTTSAVYIYKVY